MDDDEVVVVVVVGSTRARSRLEVSDALEEKEDDEGDDIVRWYDNGSCGGCCCNCSSLSLSISMLSLRLLSFSSCCFRSPTCRCSSEMTTLLLLLLLTTTSSVDANPMPSSDDDDSVSLHRFLDGKDVGERREEEMLLL